MNRAVTDTHLLLRSYANEHAGVGHYERKATFRCCSKWLADIYIYIYRVTERKYYLVKEVLLCSLLWLIIRMHNRASRFFDNSYCRQNLFWSGSPAKNCCYKTGLNELNKPIYWRAEALAAYIVNAAERPATARPKNSSRDSPLPIGDK